MGSQQVLDKYLGTRINAEKHNGTKSGRRPRNLSQAKGMVIAARNVRLTSLETQPPAEEGTRSYKMEIEGESLQSSCQEALPPAETADDRAARLSGLTHLGLSCQPKGGRWGTPHGPLAISPSWETGWERRYSAGTYSTRGFLKGVSGAPPWGGFSHRLENLGLHTCEELKNVKIEVICVQCLFMSPCCLQHPPHW